jgi:hypothetical protein
MSHRWEYEDEYLVLKSSYRKAQKEGNHQLCEALRPRINELNMMMWHAKVQGFPELAPYDTVVQAFEMTARRLGIPFPNMSQPQYRAGDGHFSLLLSDDQRTVQIWPWEDRGYYSVELFDMNERDEDRCYRGSTTSLEQATHALSQWFVMRYTIDELHTQCPWIPREPFEFNEPRISFG